MNHMFYYPHVKEDMTEEEKDRGSWWTDAAVRRFIQRVERRILMII